MSTKNFGGWQQKNGDHPERVPDDLYPSPPEATECLLKNVRFNGAIWECASGLGHISRVFLEAGYEVVSTDLRAAEYEYGEAGDFLASTETRAPNIVTNPPYKLMREFWRKAFTLPGVETVSFLVPVPSLSQVGVQKLFDEFGAPAQILVPVPHLKIYMGKERGIQTSLFAHCWVHWNLKEEKRSSSEFRLVNWRKPQEPKAPKAKKKGNGAAP